MSIILPKSQYVNPCHKKINTLNVNQKILLLRLAQKIPLRQAMNNDKTQKGMQSMKSALMKWKERNSYTIKDMAAILGYSFRQSNRYLAGEPIPPDLASVAGKKLGK
jgi:hypothetical protein